MVAQSFKAWNRERLGDVVELSYGKGLTKEERTGGPFPVYGSGGLIGYHDEPLVDGPGIIVGRKGSVGSVYYEESPFWPIDTTYFVELNSSEYDLQFVYYLLKSLDLQALNTHAAVPGLNRDVAYSQKVRIPPLETQREIARALSAYDDLIENNLRRIEILEEMARLIYREWFVHFRFPGHEEVEMVDSELGPIPEGWEVRRYDQVFNIKYGKTLPVKEMKSQGKFPVYGAGDIVGYYEEANADEPVALITCRGAGSGDVRRTNERAFVTNNSLMLWPQDPYSSWPHFFNQFHAEHSPLATVVSGSAQPQITISGLSPLMLMVPPNELVEAYAVNMRSTIELSTHLTLKNSRLVELRGLLLPRLVSGTLGVSEVKNMQPTAKA